MAALRLPLARLAVALQRVAIRARSRPVRPWRWKARWRRPRRARSASASLRACWLPRSPRSRAASAAAASAARLRRGDSLFGIAFAESAPRAARPAAALRPPAGRAAICACAISASATRHSASTPAWSAVALASASSAVRAGAFGLLDSSSAMSGARASSAASAFAPASEFALPAASALRPRRAVSRSASPRSSSSRVFCRSRSARRSSAASSWLDSAAMRWPCALASSRRSASSSRSFGELLGQRGLRLLRLFGRGLAPAATCASAPSRLLARRLGSGGGIAPAGEQQPRLGDADLVGQDLVALGLLGLPAQRGDLRCRARPSGLRAARGSFSVARSLLSASRRRTWRPAIPAASSSIMRRSVGLAAMTCGDLALADQRGRVRAGGGIGESQRHILGAHVAAVDAIGAARAALDPAGDFQFFAVVVHGVQHDFGKVARRAVWRCRRRSRLPCRPTRMRLGRVLAHHPADRFEQVGFAAAIGADDPGQAGFDAQFGRLDEALEAAEA